MEPISNTTHRESTGRSWELSPRGVCSRWTGELMKTAFAYASATRQLHGKSNSAEWRAFGIYYDDWRNILKTDNRTPAVRRADHNTIRIGRIGGHFLHSARTNGGTTDLL